MNKLSKRFNNCKNINNLSFDFYIPRLNLLIEYDGIQHFKSIDGLGGDVRFTMQNKLDAIKTSFADKCDMKLLRISYLDFKNISNILNKNCK